MNFKDLKIIVKQIKNTIRCQKCESKYTDDVIEVIGGLSDEQIFFHAYCPECDADSIVHVTVETQFVSPEMSKLTKLGNAPRIGHVSADEVLDMRNFLKSFDGNFEKLFVKK